jgi:hypothetical protein
MTIGTKSVLFGIHNPIIHGFFVFLAWWRLYGFPYNPKLWLCFLLHDIGYWGCRDLDGIRGKLHPYRGANLISLLCDSYEGWAFKKPSKSPWYYQSLYHSRYLAGINNSPPSRLCMADKAATIMTPVWLYLFIGKLTGEIYYYMDADKHRQHMDCEEWLVDIRRNLAVWVVQNKEVAV